MLPGQTRYWRLDLKPEVVDTGKVKYTRNDLHGWSPEKIFAEDDLYTTRWGSISNRDIEKFFFGRFDNDGLAAIEYFSTYASDDASETAFNVLLPYMSVQKLRTPKGLADLSEQVRT